MKDIINKEETLAFKYIPEVELYRLKILPKHPHYIRFKDKTGSLVRDPSCIGYDCWVSGECIVRGKILEETILVIGNYGSAIEERCVVKNSYVEVGSLDVMNGSEIEGLTVYSEGSSSIQVTISQSILSAKVNLWPVLNMRDRKIRIENSIISGITTVNSYNLTIEDSNLSGGPFVISNEVRSIKGIYESGAFEFREKEIYKRDGYN